MKLMKWSPAIAMALFLSACSWVEVSPEGEDVRVLEPSQVTNCERVGKTTVKTKASVGALKRHEEQVQEELDILARNSAPEIGGDTVVAQGKPENGEQVYVVYRCIK